MALLVSACAPLRPDEGHALVLSTGQQGDDYLLPVPGPRSIPLIDSEPPDPDKIHVRLSDAEVAELLRRKISARPIREDERRVTVLGNHVVKNEEIYSLEVYVHIKDMRHHCDTTYVVEISAEGIPQRIQVAGLPTCTS